MSQYSPPIHHAAAWLLGLSVFLYVEKVWSVGLDNAESGNAVKSIDSAPPTLEQIIEAKLRFYASNYSNVLFVVLDASGNVDKNMRVLLQLIGPNPIPMDYAHHLEARNELLLATLLRVRSLLHDNRGSSSLFKIQGNAAVPRPYVCIITLDPVAIARDDGVATRDLLNLSDEKFNAIAPANYLNHIAYLRFVMDHEVYHCLDSLHNGPIPMSSLAHWDDYMFLRNEYGADAFGAIMHIAEYGSSTRYVQQLAKIRALALHNNDPDHFTSPVLHVVLALDPNCLAKTNLKERFTLATTIRNEKIGDYDTFRHYAAAAMQTLVELGFSREPEPEGYGDIDYQLVDELLTQTHRSYRQLTGKDRPQVFHQIVGP